MTVELPRPGDLIKWGTKQEMAQVVWVGQLKILRYGNLEELEAMCLFLVKRGRYKTVTTKNKKTTWKEAYWYSRELIGKDGL